MSTLNQIKVEDTLYDIEDKQAREELLNRVEKINGKGLSSNDFTNEYKTKLDNLLNYDDTELRNELDNKANKNEIPSIEGLATEEYVDSAIANLPSGGSSSGGGINDNPMELINEITLKEEVQSVTITEDANGEPLELEDFHLEVQALSNVENANRISGHVQINKTFLQSFTGVAWGNQKELGAYTATHIFNAGQMVFGAFKGSASSWANQPQMALQPIDRPITSVTISLATFGHKYLVGSNFKLYGRRVKK